MRRGDRSGADAFRKELLESVHSHATETHHPETRRETTEEKSRRILLEGLDKPGWAGAALARRAKGDPRKVRVAQWLQPQTSGTLKWIAAQLPKGTWTHVMHRLKQVKNENRAEKPNSLR